MARVCLAAVACFGFAGLAYWFLSALAIGVALMGVMLLLLGVFGMIFGRLPNRFLDWFFEILERSP